MPSDGGESSSSEPSGIKKKEKRVLQKGSVPTIQCANTAPEQEGESDRARRRRSREVSLRFVVYWVSIA